MALLNAIKKKYLSLKDSEVEYSKLRSIKFNANSIGVKTGKRLICVIWKKKRRQKYSVVPALNQH